MAEDVRLPAGARPERKPGEAGLRVGELMRGGDAKLRRAARSTTYADPLERAGSARARFARSAVPKTRAKAQLSVGTSPKERASLCRRDVRRPPRSGRAGRGASRIAPGIRASAPALGRDHRPRPANPVGAR